jgi:hypothetical protein
MVRIRVSGVSPARIRKFVSMFLEMNPAVYFYERLGFKEYRYNWRIQEQNLFGDMVSWWFGFRHNSEKRSYSLVVEFNPNKCVELEILNLLRRYFFKYRNYIVVSVDIAIDIPENIQNILYDRGQKRIEKVFSFGGDDRTIYIGSGAGRVKIYNKARESGLSYDLTRYEITIKVGQYLSDIGKSEIKNDIPKIYRIGSESCLNGTDRAILFAVQNGYPLSELTRDKKQKIKNALQEIHIEKEKMLETIFQHFEEDRRKYIQYIESISEKRKVVHRYILRKMNGIFRRKRQRDSSQEFDKVSGLVEPLAQFQSSLF